MDGIPRYQFPEDKQEISPHKYYKRYKLWDFEMVKLKNTKNYYTQLTNIAADKVRKRMTNYSPSLLEVHQRKKFDDIQFEQEQISLMKPFQIPNFLRNAQTKTNTIENASQRSNSPKQNPERKTSFITSPTRRVSILNNTVSQGLTSRIAIDPKLTNTCNPIPRKSVYSYLKRNLCDNILPPSILDPDFVPMKKLREREAQKMKAQSKIAMDNIKFKQTQDLIKGIKNRNYRKPVYKFQILKEKSDKLNDEHAQIKLKMQRRKYGQHKRGGVFKLGQELPKIFDETGDKHVFTKQRAKIKFGFRSEY